MTITNSSTRLIAIATGVAVALALMGAAAVAPAQAASLTQAQIQSIVSLLASFGANQATINNVTAALNGQATTGTTSGGSMGACPALSRSLSQGSNGADVMALQVFLNSNAQTQVAASGAGSPGLESTYFGGLTKAAVIKFQTLNGVSPIGIVGPATRAAIAAVCGKTSGTTGTGGTVTTGGSVTVSAATQPVNSLAVAGASRVPFTTFTLTNNSNAAVTINSVTVQRTGLGTDNNFSGIVLLDNNGLQVGISHTLNSNHQANIGDNFMLGAGQSVTYTVAGNIATGLSNNGQVVSLQVVAVNTSATVSGSLPISGASQTINNSLTLGTVSTSTSSFDPGTAQTKSIGSTAVRFTGLRFTAGSAEDLKLYSIRWRQVGTASSNDISNVMTVVNGTSYPTTIDSTGKYYTTVFSGGVLIAKGNSVDVYVEGDITGNNAAGQTVQFNIDKVTDVYFVGQLYGYGIAPSGTSQPWLTGFVTTVQGGSATVIQNATSVASANIPVNVTNTVLGGFQTNFTGEPVSVSGLKFTVTTTGTSTAVDPLTSVSIVDQNGNVVSGPVDGVGNGSNTQLLSFGDTVTFPVGLQTYTLKGKVPADYPNGATIVLSTTANSTNWVNATGQTTGNTISLPGTTVTMNVQTVKGANLTVTASPNPVAENIVPGNSVQLAQIQLDASQSGEDIRMNNLLLSFTGATTATSNLNTCQLWNGSNALNTGTNVVNSSNINNDGTTPGTFSSGSATTFSFDNSFTIPKGTVVTLTLACNVATGATGGIAVGVQSSFSNTATGISSGNSLGSNLVVTNGFSGTQTIASGGTVTVTVDSSSPSRTLAAAGTSGATIGVVKLHATNENVNLTKLGLTLANGTYGTKSTGSGASSNNGVNDVTRAYVYQGSTLVGTVTFTGTSQTATSTLTTPVVLMRDQDTLLTIKADLASIGVSAAGGIGDVVKIDPLNTQGTGVNSGTTINTGASAGVNGIELFKSYPTVAFVANSASNPNGTAQTLKRFTVTSTGAGSIGIYQVKISIATSTNGATVNNLKLVAYTDAGYSVGVSNQGSGSGVIQTIANPANGSNTFTVAANPVEVGSTPTYFAVLGDVTPGSNQNWTVNVTVQGDNATTTNAAGYNANQASSVSPSAFVWSDNATTTSASTDIDWFNGFQVPGLPSTGI